MAAWALQAIGAQAPINLGTAGNFTLLAKTGISTTGATSVLGDIGVSPIDSTGITGFTLSLNALNTFATSPLVTGKAYASDYTAPTPSKLTTAIADMETAYSDAAGRNLPDTTELGAGNISGLTLAPGLHKWGTGVLLTSEVTFAGDADAIWILQIAENLTVGDGAMVHLSGGALAGNIFWQVAGEVNLGTTSDFKGIVLSRTGIHARTGAAITGRLLAQSAVTLDASSVTNPSKGNLGWFGAFNDALFDHNSGHGWILHTEHGWLYLTLHQDQVWFWEHIRQGWFWTHSDLYPYGYSDTRAHWEYYHLGGTPNLRWFFLFTDNQQNGSWVEVRP